MSLNPSKGVDYYAYLGDDSFNVTFQKPTDWGKKTTTVAESTTGQMLGGNFQIAESDIGIFSHTGRFQWTANQDSAGIGTQYADIAPLTGNIGSSSMGDMLNTPSVIKPAFALSYGFYDSGPGFGSLTDQDQAYVYATPNVSRWMTELIGEHPEILDARFSLFALPGAHDAGMNTTATIDGMLSNPLFLAALAAATGVAPALLGTSALRRAVVNLAITQKDSFTCMLDLGVRYFDFRPGYTYKNVVSGLYHQHNFIPGCAYADFLADVLTWLAANPSEFVVISLQFSGFADAAMKPTVDELQSALASAQAQTHTQGIQAGGPSAR